MIAIRAPRDFWAGVLYLSIGLVGLVIARNFSFGSGPRMGPGNFPTILSVLLMAIGAASLIKAILQSGEAIGTIAWRPLFLVTVGTVLFGLLLEPAGAVVSISVLLAFVFFASRQSRADFVTLLTFAGLVAFCIFVFVKGLGVPMPILGDWFGM